jgi:hypothetical protein
VQIDEGLTVHGKYVVLIGSHKSNRDDSLLVRDVLGAATDCSATCNRSFIYNLEVIRSGTFYHDEQDGSNFHSGSGSQNQDNLLN